MNANEAWKPSDHVVFSELDDGIVLLDTRTNIYYSLDGVGPFLWEGIKEGQGSDGLLAAVTGQFDVDHATAQADIAEWLESMGRAGLIEPVRELS